MPRASWLASATWASGSITGCPAASVAVRSIGSNSPERAERGTGRPDPPDDPLLVGERRAVPDLDQVPDPPGDHVAATDHPGRLVAGGDPHVLVELGGAGPEVVGAVLEAQQVPGRALARGGRRGATEALLRPPHPHDAPAHPGEVADGVEQHLGVVAAGLHAEVATAAGGVEGVAGERRDVGQRGRAGRGQAEAVDPVALEQRRAHAEGQREPGGVEALGLAGVGRRQRRARRRVVDRAAPRSAARRRSSSRGAAARARPGGW